MVTAADTGDRAAAQVMLRQVADAQHQLELVWADGGYTGSLVEYCLATLALVLAIVKRSDDMRGFVVAIRHHVLEMPEPVVAEALGHRHVTTAKFAACQRSLGFPAGRTVDVHTGGQELSWLADSVSPLCEV